MSDIDEDEFGPTVPTVEYSRAAHVASVRLANAGRGVTEMARLVKLGTMPAESLEAAEVELEAARAAVELVEATPIGEVPDVHVYAAIGADPLRVRYLRKPVRTGSGMSFPMPVADPTETVWAERG